MPLEQIAHFRILSKLGEGGMGEVYLAEDTRLNRKVALKLLPAELAQDQHRRQRFLTEARAASALNHPNVCVIHEVGETQDHRPYITMEYVGGQTLAARMAAGRLQIAEIVEIAIQMADALDAAAAKGIIHRDIKPANISINERGQVKVLDFGLAKQTGIAGAADSDSSTQLQTVPGRVMGTPTYMSPEQALGREVDHRSDLFSFGVVIYEVLTGKPPFSGAGIGETIQQIINAQPEALARYNYEVPAELERITLKCLQKNPDRRYQTARELLVDLRNLRSTLEAGPAAETIVLPARQPPVASGPSDGSAPPSPAEEIKKSDVFINCSLVDDQPLLPGKPGWVSQFKRNLELRLEQLSGKPIRITSYPVPGGIGQVDEALSRNLPLVKAMISVVSPPFVKSEGCRQEVETFWQSAEQAGTLWVDDKSRIFKVIKTPVPPEEVPPGLAALLSQLLSFRFYEEDPETGRWREFDESFGPELQQRYFETVYDLAHEICQVVKRYDPEKPAPPAIRSGSKTVYLAETTSDLRPERERIQRELIERGHRVVPDGPLPMVAEDLEKRVQGLLAESQLAVHLVGERYGLVPEDATESLVELQNRLAAEAAANPALRRLIWMPRGLNIKDERQAAFVKRLRDDLSLQRGAELVEAGLNELKSLAVHQLSPPPAKAAPVHASPLSSGMPQIYLICDPADEEAIEPLEDWLFQQGVEVRTPDFEATEAEAAEAHVNNLRECDAALIYYGNVRKSWVETLLRDLMKAPGYGRERPILAQAVCLAPPLDRRKERFRTHTAEILRQDLGFEPAAFEALIQTLKTSRPAP